MPVLSCGGMRFQYKWQDVPPDEAWRTIETEHFRVSFPERLDLLGRRAAVIAESALDRLEAEMAAGGDLTVASTVGQALAADYYLSDDPLAVLDEVRSDDGVQIRLWGERSQADHDAGRSVEV